MLSEFLMTSGRFELGWVFSSQLFIVYWNNRESKINLICKLIIAKKLPKTAKLDYNKVDSLLEEVMKMLNKLISQLAPKA